MTARRPSASSKRAQESARRAIAERFVDRFLTLAQAYELLSRLGTRARAVHGSGRVRQRNAERAR